MECAELRVGVHAECFDQRHVAVGKEFGVLHPTLDIARLRQTVIAALVLKTCPFFSAFLMFLSRACLGKMFGVSYTRYYYSIRRERKRDDVFFSHLAVRAAGAVDALESVLQKNSPFW